ncbi:uncharacterized protein LOC112524940 [Cynara cardunculus var. scolymus]|uniref:uncharacterized protein LOC112524940 n=1 Tax=Cynara cardunculus var. scolymus TaxID=59895 RepID=UPI000D62F2FA|nr:uncharacterized protein LOC112524940 [Cynara cardunculus var. scolymus]
MFIDRALVWWDNMFESLDPITQENMKWKEFRTLFFEQYCPADLQKRLEKEFLDLKQGSMTVIDYETEFNRKARFAQRFLTSDQDKIDHFVDGLRREIRDFVANRDISSFGKAVEYARRREHDLTIPDDTVSTPKRQRTDRTFSAPSHKPSRLFTPKRAQTQNNPRASSQVYTLRSSTPKDCQRCGKTHQGRCDSDRPVVKCFCCGEAGHVRTNCPQRDLACFSCGVLGHHRKECPRIKRVESKASVQQPARRGTSTEKEDVPRARARAFQITTEEALKEPDVVAGIFPLNNRPACVLFDSGATNSYVSLYYTQYLNSGAGHA